MLIFIKTVFLLSLTGSMTYFLLLLLSYMFKYKVSISLLYYGFLFLTLFWFMPMGILFSFDVPMPVNLVSSIIPMPAASDISREFIVNFISEGKTILYWIGGIYCFVSGVLLLRFLFQYQRQKQMLRKNSWEITDQDDIQCLQALMRQYRITGFVQLRCSILTRTPFLVGLFRYQIVLPNYTLQDEQLELVLKHEFIHLKRYDNLIKIYLELLKCVHWFNPVFYFMRKKIDYLCEMSCDEMLVSKFDLQQRKQYSLLILNLVQYGQRGSKLCSGFNQNVDLLKNRLLHIMQCKSSTKFMRVVFVLLISLICITGCNFSAATNEQVSTPIASEIEGEGNVDNMQKPIETFSWEERPGEDYITLKINGNVYTFRPLDNGCIVISDIELTYYWDALAELPKEDLPEDVYKLLYD